MNIKTMRVDIYYHLTKGDFIAETRVTLTLKNTIAMDVFKNGRKSKYVKDEIPHNEPPGELAAVLHNLAKLQGYDTGRFIFADYEGGKTWKEDVNL